MFKSLDIYQLLEGVEQNIVICRWRADQSFADAEGRDSIIVLSFAYKSFDLSFFIRHATRITYNSSSENSLVKRAAIAYKN